MHSFASDEEKYFSFYVEELKEAGYIRDYEYQPDAYVLATPFFYEYDKQLKTKTKVIVQKFIQEHIYTPDYLIYFYEKARGLFFNTFSDRANLKKIPFVANEGKTKGMLPFSVIEIKAGFSKFNMGREAGLHQKWVMARYGEYVQKVIISNKTGIFKTTFTPEKFLTTNKSGKDRKIHFQPKTLEEFLNGKTKKANPTKA